MHNEFTMLIELLGMPQSASELAIIKTQEDATWIEAGDNVILQSQINGLSLTFNADDILCKIEMMVPKKYYQYWYQANIPGLQDSHLKSQLIEVLGMPEAVIKLPQQKNEEQLLYNKVQYWLSLKCKDEKLISVSLLIPSLIPDSIKHNQVPTRTSHSKN